MSVRVNEVIGVAGFVMPGTRVDVLLTGNPSGAGDQQTTTVLENIAVIATGQKLERNTAGDPQLTPVITLLVSPDDAQKLTLATAQGKIQLALRNPLDTKQQALNSVSTSSLYKGVPTPAPVTAAPRPKSTTHAVKAPAPPPPAVYSVEVIKGTKREEVTKF
jgi:pilus assembly protein CpaB